MAKLILSMDGLVLKEIQLSKERTTIGRKPHNDIQIDNLAVSGEHDGLALDAAPFQILAREREPQIVRCERVGITLARHQPWRLCVGVSPYLSRGPGRA